MIKRLMVNQEFRWIDMIQQMMENQEFWWIVMIQQMMENPGILVDCHDTTDDGKPRNSDGLS